MIFEIFRDKLHGEKQIFLESIIKYTYSFLETKSGSTFI